MRKILLVFAGLLSLIGCVIICKFLKISSSEGFGIGNNYVTDYEITGQFGDFIGGVVGTLFALAGTLLIFLSFYEQNNQNRRNNFEASFFEMIRLHRANVEELNYEKDKGATKVRFQNRQVCRVIFKEVLECYAEVKKFSNSTKVSDYIRQDYQDKLQALCKENRIKQNLIQIALIDIAYSIVFYGLGTEGVSILRRNFSKKYNPYYYYRLLYFIKLKPKSGNRERFMLWSTIRKYDLKTLHLLIEDLYKIRTKSSKISGESQMAKDLDLPSDYEKYYGGHQFRLGHYFRHLFQAYKYIDSSPDIADRDRYRYGKMLRGQLSSYEQALIFVNSISSLGRKWEYIPEKFSAKSESYKTETKKLNLITKYNIIKNLPGNQFYDIKFKDYYREVEYESDEATE